jgi:hypothetical protein
MGWGVKLSLSLSLSLSLKELKGGVRVEPLYEVNFLFFLFFMKHLQREFKTP